jgi:hypothetical protein
LLLSCGLYVWSCRFVVVVAGCGVGFCFLSFAVNWLASDAQEVGERRPILNASLGHNALPLTINLYVA